MASLNTLRTKFGVLLSAIIAGALLAFIFSLRTEMGFSDNDPKVGEINGSKVLYSDFSDAYNDAKMLSGSNDWSDAIGERLVSTAWSSLMTDRVVIPSLNSLGLTVPEEERLAMLTGERPSGVYASLFSDPRTGEYDVNSVTGFLSQVEGNPQAQQMWNLYNKQAVVERQMSKYASLVRGGAYVNALEVENGLHGENSTYKGRFAVCRYTSVPDSTVSVSNSEIRAYYKAHKSQYKQQPYRTVNYVVFDVNPTDADREDIENQAREASAAFAGAADIRAFVRENRHASAAAAFLTADRLSEAEAAALDAGRMYGPELVGNEWRAARVMEVRNVADTLELQHIVLPFTDDKLADSLLNAARHGADFAAMAREYSLAETAADGGNAGKIAYSVLPAELADELNGATRGDVVKVGAGNAIQLIKVTGAGKVRKHMKIANLVYPVVASEATKRAKHTEASQFSVGAQGSVEKFNEAAAAQSLSPRVMNVERGARSVRGLDNSLEVVRWAAAAKVGEVSEIFTVGDNYVVAVVSNINDDEWQSVEDVASQIRSTLIRDKKFEQLAAKLQGADIDEAAANAGEKVNEFENAKFGSYYVQGLGVEPRLLGAITTTAAGQEGELSQPVKGLTGVYVFVVDEITEADEPQTAEAERVKEQSQAEMMAVRRAMMSIQEEAGVKDNSVRYF